MDWIQQIPNWLPVAIFLFGIQAWALRVQYSTKSMITAVKNDQDKRAISDDARYEALRLEVSGKVGHEQARTVVHQYHVDEKRMRQEILEELGLDGRRVGDYRKGKEDGE